MKCVDLLCDLQVNTFSLTRPEIFKRATRDCERSDSDPVQLATFTPVLVINSTVVHTQYGAGDCLPAGNDDALLPPVLQIVQPKPDDNVS